jgi:gliding motility-associated lipoprotein GldH
MKTLSIIFFLSFCFLFSSCSEEHFYEKSFSFKENKWSQDEKPSFVVEIQDTSVAYDFILTLRNTTNYEYSNIWLFLNTKTPDGQKAREPFELKITDPNGAWIGKKSGTIVENQLLFKRRKLPLSGKYYFTLEQGITKEVINELLDVSLVVEKAK